MTTRALRLLAPILAAFLNAHVLAARPPEVDPNELGTRYAKSRAEFVPPEEREALGLDDTKWTKQHGKVHPDVYAALDKAEKVTEPWRDPAGLSGTAYVQVQLKYARQDKPGSAADRAAIKRLEDKLLSGLTSAEFYVEYPMQTAPGVLGYATRAGIEKLKSATDVTAICLDERPFPERPNPVTRDDLPAARAGDPATQPAQGRFWGNGGKVEADVYRALALHERVFVMVSLREATADERLADQVGKGRAIEEPVLKALSAREFWLQYRTAIRSSSGPLLMGEVTKEGLEKLVARPEVDGIGLTQRFVIAP